jgi:hypothetical protein
LWATTGDHSSFLLCTISAASSKLTGLGCSDIGGGWPIDTYNNEANGIRVAEYQFSDIALQWMLSELQETEKSNAVDDRLKFTPEMDEFMEKFDPESDNYTKALSGRIHDQLQWHGSSYRQLTPFETLGWWFLGRILPYHCKATYFAADQRRMLAYF